MFCNPVIVRWLDRTATNATTEGGNQRFLLNSTHIWMKMTQVTIIGDPGNNKHLLASEFKPSSNDDVFKLDKNKTTKQQQCPCKKWRLESDTKKAGRANLQRRRPCNLLALVYHLPLACMCWRECIQPPGKTGLHEHRSTHTHYFADSNTPSSFHLLPGCASLANRFVYMKRLGGLWYMTHTYIVAYLCPSGKYKYMCCLV